MLNGRRTASSGLVTPWQACQVSGAIRIRGTLSIPAAELAWRFSRSSGPGGQSVNTSDSRVELLFDLASSPSIPPVLKARAIERLGPRLQDGVLVVVASGERSQLRNRVGCAPATVRDPLGRDCSATA